MYLRYRNHTHALDEAAVAISEEVEHNEHDEPVRSLVRWAIQGMLLAADQAGIIAAMRAVEEAYSQDGGDIYLLTNDGVTVAHSILSSETESGVLVKRRPSYPVGAGAELSAFRTFELVVEATKTFDGALGSIISFNETLTFSGGGPRYNLLELRNGPPQVQRVSQQTPYMATQSGEAVGYNFWPTPPRPIWGGSIFDQPASSTSLRSPQRKGPRTRRKYREFPVSWSYSFKSATPLSGVPNLGV